MVHRKITIKEMKRDEFRQAVFAAWERTVSFLVDNVRAIAAGLVAVVVIVVAVVFLFSWMQGRQADSRAALGKALALLPDSSFARRAEGEEADLEAAAEALAGVMDHYPRQEGGTLALYYLGLVRLEQGRAEEATASARQFLQKHPDNDLAPLALWIDARAQAQMGNADEVVSAYRKIVDKDAPLLAPDLARLYLAQYLEGQGRSKEALDLYRVVVDGTDGPWKSQAQQKVGQLAPLLGEEITLEKEETEEEAPPA